MKEDRVGAGEKLLFALGDFFGGGAVSLVAGINPTLASAICTLIPAAILESLKAGSIDVGTFYVLIGFVLGAFFALPLVLIGLFARERTKPPESRSVFSLGTFVKSLRVRSFRQLVGMYLSQAISVDILSAGVVYYSLYVAKASATIFIGIFVGQPLSGIWGMRIGMSGSFALLMSIGWWIARRFARNSQGVARRTVLPVPGMLSRKGRRRTPSLAIHGLGEPRSSPRPRWPSSKVPSSLVDPSPALSSRSMPSSGLRLTANRTSSPAPTSLLAPAFSPSQSEATAAASKCTL